MDLRFVHPAVIRSNTAVRLIISLYAFSITYCKVEVQLDFKND